MRGARCGRAVGCGESNECEARTARWNPMETSRRRSAAPGRFRHVAERLVPHGGNDPGAALAPPLDEERRVAGCVAGDEAVATDAPPSRATVHHLVRKAADGLPLEVQVEDPLQRPADPRRARRIRRREPPRTLDGAARAVRRVDVRERAGAGKERDDGAAPEGRGGTGSYGLPACRAAAPCTAGAYPPAPRLATAPRPRAPRRERGRRAPAGRGGWAWRRKGAGSWHRGRRSAPVVLARGDVQDQHERLLHPRVHGLAASRAGKKAQVRAARSMAWFSVGTLLRRLRSA